MIMEPVVKSLLLHPALLIVSGFESISSDDVRFLNAYRSHFDNKTEDDNLTKVYTERDFELGGILNPTADFGSSYEKINQALSLFPTYPYLTRANIWQTLYAPTLVDIFYKLLGEVFQNLTTYSVYHKRPSSFFQSNTSVIRSLESSPCYGQIAALHMCGLGDKLGNAFDWVFSRYRAYDERLRVRQA